MSDRQLPRDDHELELMTGITPADHQHTSSSVIEKMERQMLGPDWYRRRKQASPPLPPHEPPPDPS